MGQSAVSFFFVLSGFLITFLLLAERRKCGHIDVRSFYARRALRIWPLYYLVTLWAFAFLPRLVDVGQPSGGALALFLLMLPNVALVLYPPVAGAAQGWSIGVEEQFYLAWPLVVERFARNPLPVFALIVALKALALYLFAERPRAAALLFYCRFEDMAMGGMAGYAYFAGRVPRFLMGRPAKSTVVLAALALVPARELFLLHPLAEGAVYAALVLQVACSPDFWRRAEGRRLNYLGNVSYGVYMLHPTPLTLAAPALSALALPAYVLSLYAVTFGGTLALAAFSYRYFESPFLRLKNRLAVVGSGGPAPPAPGSDLRSGIPRE